ncbi:hypothetical protein SAMN05444344_0710 [Tenacibaculum mesophilum]|uniref:Uncharacterized protein n=1 Tax=Tenacibaculum mesophilum TaxID=104268 RepID=A0ABN5T828_9FLAO|nr:hypothetical protein [Tenacibaculum mesophilum]AZJ33492.1 hypothetical protein D6200_13325 [Tenacibaculum mesophilum]QFS28732.1 hypothetical protein F9Y86_10135 [Tenacibaculum mesophilum]SHF59793.1 hypothetical protein SAMN05444344_0710 [Tenacibaculum mesophilum]
MTIKEFEKRAEYQNGYDREFDNWKIINIHQIPDEFMENHEIDFYCSNGLKVYLLRFRNRTTESYVINDDSKDSGYPPYLIADFPILRLDNEVIKMTLEKFNLI